MTDKPAAALTEEDFANPSSTVTLNTSVSAAPKGVRLPIDGSATLAELALAINALHDIVDDIHDALDRLEALDFSTTHILSALNLKVPNNAG